MGHRARPLVVGLACLGLGGCSPLGATSTTASTTVSKLAQAQATHEYPSPAPPPQSASAPSPSADRAVRTFAARYINWTADSVASQMRELAASSIGQARSAMQLAAAQTAGDYELQRGGIANHGTVEAVAPLRGSPDRYVVVTLETTTAALSTAYQGLRPAWHVALATVSAVDHGRWVVSGWQPES
jgi:hypothetical protein